MNAATGHRDNCTCNKCLIASLREANLGYKLDYRVFAVMLLMLDRIAMLESALNLTKPPLIKGGE